MVFCCIKNFIMSIQASYAGFERILDVVHKICSSVNILPLNSESTDL